MNSRTSRLPGRSAAHALRARHGRFAVIADPQGAAFAVFEGETDP